MRSLAILALKKPDSNLIYGFESLRLPFGSIFLIIYVNRIARLYQCILYEIVILAANYFDDYPIVELGGLTQNTESTLRAVTNILDFNATYYKDAPFQRKVDLLGVILDLGDESLQCVKVANKESRVSDMSAALSKVFHDDFIVPSIMPSLFGRLQFCEIQLLGLQGRLAMSDLRFLEKLNVRKMKLNNDQIEGFKFLLQKPTLGKPRTISATSKAAPCLAFTDGTCKSEGDTFVGSIGGILVIPNVDSFSMCIFGCFIKKNLIRKWSVSNKKHLIGPVERFAVCIARKIWKAFLENLCGPWRSADLPNIGSFQRSHLENVPSNYGAH